MEVMNNHDMLFSQTKVLLSCLSSNTLDSIVKSEDEISFGLGREYIVTIKASKVKEGYSLAIVLLKRRLLNFRGPLEISTNKSIISVEDRKFESIENEFSRALDKIDKVFFDLMCSSKEPITFTMSDGTHEKQIEINIPNNRKLKASDIFIDRRLK